MTRTVALGRHEIGGQRTFIIAEAGINHDGDMGRARELIRAAAETGVDAIKFQTHFAADEMLETRDSAAYLKETLYELMVRMEMSFDQHAELKEMAERAGLTFLSTPFSRRAIDLLEKLGVAGYKVGSGELTNLPFLGYIARQGKPMLISTGMSSFAEIERSVAFLKERHAKLAVFSCTSMYPTPPEKVRLPLIQKFQQSFGVPVGLSDHSASNYSAFAAVALGASMVEKHFTVSRQWPGPDQASSIEPSELRDLVAGIRSIEKSMQLGEKEILSEEQPLTEIFREAIVAWTDIPAGGVLTEENIWVKRPGKGIPASEYFGVLGKRAARALKKDEVLHPSHLA
jgi:sialic acid synthase SpsE